MVKQTLKDLRSFNWFLTWNNYEEDSADQLIAFGGVTRYCIQEEIGKEGTPHLQGVIVFSRRKRLATLHQAFPKVHWEKCRDLQAAKIYCTKLDSQKEDGKQWIKGFHIPKPVTDPLEDKDLHDWQKEILEMVRGPADDRKVYWYWSSEGNIGKTVLCKHMVLKEDALVVGGKFKDAYYAIAQCIQKKKDVNIVCFALSRSQGNKVSYIAIEGIKDGMFFSPKYESGMCVYNPPHVLVFANEAPDLTMLSRDRWIVKCLDPPLNFGWQDDDDDDN